MSRQLTCGVTFAASQGSSSLSDAIPMGLLLDRSELGFKQFSLYLVARVLQNGVFRVFSRLPLSQYAVLAVSLSVGRLIG